MQSKAEWRIERCDWDHNAPDEQVFSEDENQILPLPLSSHESIGDAFMNHKLVGIYEYMGEFFMLFLLDQDLEGWQKTPYWRLSLLKMELKIHNAAGIDRIPEVVIDLTSGFLVAAHIVDNQRHLYNEIYVVHESYFLSREIIYQEGWQQIYLIRSARVSGDQTIKFRGYPFDFPPISDAWAHYVETEKIITVKYNRRSRDRSFIDGMDSNLFQNRMRSFYQVRSFFANGFRRCFKNVASMISSGTINWDENNTISFQFVCSLEQARWVFENKTLFAGCFDTVRGDRRGALDYRRECYIVSRDGCSSSTIEFPQARFLQKTVIDIEQFVPMAGAFYFCEPIRTEIDGHRFTHVSLIRSNPNLLLRYDILEGNFIVEAPIEMCDDVLGSVGSKVATGPVLGRKLEEYAKSLHETSLTLERRLADGTEQVKVLHVEVLYMDATTPKIVVWTRFIRDEYCVEFWDDQDKGFSYLYGQCWDLEDINIVSMRINNTKTRYRSALEELGGVLPSESQSELRRVHNYMGRL
jgi:hypothetical protein